MVWIVLRSKDVCTHTYTCIHIYIWYYKILIVFSATGFSELWCCQIWSLLVWKYQVSFRVSYVENLACPDVSKAHRKFDYYCLWSTWMFFCYLMFLLLVVCLFIIVTKVAFCVRFVSNQFRCFLSSVWNTCPWKTSRNSVLFVYALECSSGNILFGIFKNSPTELSSRVSQD